MFDTAAPFDKTVTFLKIKNSFESRFWWTDLKKNEQETSTYGKLGLFSLFSICFIWLSDIFLDCLRPCDCLSTIPSIDVENWFCKFQVWHYESFVSSTNMKNNEQIWNILYIFLLSKTPLTKEKLKLAIFIISSWDAYPFHMIIFARPMTSLNNLTDFGPTSKP